MEVSGTTGNFDIDFDFLSDFDQTCLPAASKVETSPNVNSDSLSFDEVFNEPYRSRCNTWPRLQHQQLPSAINETVPAAETSEDHDKLLQSHIQQLGGYNQQSFNPPSALNPDDLSPYSPSSALDADPLPFVSEEEYGAGETEVLSVNPVKKYAFSGGGGGTRRNPWGNMSYADLIIQAIRSSPEQRLTLAQIYDWLIKNFPYFADKSDNFSSIGWKNSIRHNLSLHSKFVRVQNEGTGKSSWWTLDPEVAAAASSNVAHGTKKAATSPGSDVASGNAMNTSKMSRRRANTLDSVSKISERRKFLKFRRRVDSRLSERAASSSSLSAATTAGHQYLMQKELFLPEATTFRPRSSSNASSVNGGCHSPKAMKRSASLAGAGNIATGQDRLQFPMTNNWTINGHPAAAASPIFPNFNEKLTLSDVDTSKDIIGNEYTDGSNNGNGIFEDFDFDTSQLLVSSIMEPPQPQQTTGQQFKEWKNLKIKILEPREAQLRSANCYSRLTFAEGLKPLNYGQQHRQSLDEQRLRSGLPFYTKPDCSSAIFCNNSNKLKQNSSLVDALLAETTDAGDYTGNDIPAYQESFDANSVPFAATVSSATRNFDSVSNPSVNSAVLSLGSF